MKPLTMAADKKALWRFRHAQQCFEYAATTSDRIIHEKWPLDHPLIYQMSIAIAVLYARPFTNCYGLGPLDKNFVPHEYWEKHKRLMAMRHRVFAHYDVTAPVGSAITDLASEMRFSLAGRELNLELKETPLVNEAFDQIKELSEKLEQKCRWHIQKIIKRYEKELPKRNGVYKFDLGDANRFFGDPDN
jgi:hypothetical protein